MGRVWGVLVASAACFAAGLGVEARQEKPVVPADAGLQDRVTLVGSLDSWYKIFQGDVHVGFVHETVAKGTPGTPWKYKYDADSELEMMLPDPTGATKKEFPFTESLKVKSHLDDTFSPLDMERTDIRNGVIVNSRILPEDSGRKIEIALSSTNRKVHPIADEEIYFSRFLMFLALRQSGNLAKAGPRKVSLFAPREDDKPPIAEVQIEIKDFVKREYLGKKDIPVTHVVYLKPPPSATRDMELTEAFIDKYGRIVEEVSRSGLRRILVKDELDAVGKDTRIRQGARRDPFDKLAVMNRPTGGGKEGAEKTQIVIDENTFLTSLKEAQKTLEDLRRAKEDNREVEGQKLYDGILNVYIALKKSHSEKPQPPDVLAQVERLRDEAEKIWGGLDRLMKKLRGVYVKVLQHFDKDECEEMQKGIDELKKTALERKELVDRPELLEVNRWIGELEPLVAKCRTRQELARKRVVLTGTVIHDSYQFIPVDARVVVFGHHVGAIHPVRFMKPDRLAVVNEKMYRVGDTVDGEGVRVEKIWAHGIQVSLREETRDIPIRQK